MASEDSRYRDRCLRFIVSVMEAMRRSPCSVRCAPACIICRTCANRTKSACFAVLNGLCSKNGTTDATRSALRFTLKRRSDARWLSWRCCSITDPHPNTSREEVECGSRRCGLGDGELVLDLPAEPTPRVAHHRDREASFAVDEPDDPLLSAWPFLLIVRTGRIVTIPCHAPYEEGVTRIRTAGCSGFPAYSQLRFTMSPW